MANTFRSQCALFHRNANCVLLGFLAMLSFTQPGLGRLQIAMPDFSDLFLPEYSRTDMKLVNARLQTRPEQQLILETLFSDYMVDFTIAAGDLRSRITDIHPLDSDKSADESRSKNQIQSDLRQTIEAFQQAQESGDVERLAVLKQELKQLKTRSIQELESIKPEPMEPEETREAGVKIVQLFQDWRIQRNDLRVGFEEGIKAILDADQVGRWPQVSMSLRRIHELQDSRFSGESQDILEAIESLSIPVVEGNPIAVVLAAYESELDEALKEKREYLENSKFELFDAALAGDSGRGKIVIERELELRTRIQQVHLVYAEETGRLLDGEQKALFIQELRTKAFPRIYRPTRFNRLIEKAIALEGLDVELHASLLALVSEYGEASGQATEELYRVSLQHEPDLVRMRMLHRLGLKRPDSTDDQKEPIQEAFQNRAKIDREFEDRLRSLLGENRFDGLAG